MNDLQKTVLAALIVACVSSAGAVTYVVQNLGHGPYSHADLLSTFSSYRDLRGFLGSGGSGNMSYGISPTFGAPSPDFARGSGAGIPYSQTNVQVAGVDEQDIVKTDGTYLYIASASSRVAIVKAYPPSDLRNVSVIEARDILGPSNGNVSAYVQGLYVSDGRLMIILTACDQCYFFNRLEIGGFGQASILGPRTYVATYDVSNPYSPKQLSVFGVSGWEQTSRMTGNVVFLVTQYYPWLTAKVPSTPSIWIRDTPRTVDLGSIYYDPQTKEVTGLVNLLVVDTHSGHIECMSLVAGWGTTVYMSPDALYLTFQKWDGALISKGNGTVAEREDTTRTTIYKIAVSGTAMTVAAKGEVGGWVLNQFSLDQSGPYLRVATTTEWSDMRNSVYVLGKNLEVVGALKNLAPGERIFSARYVGDLLYLITFRQTDPLFVIDLRNPSSPSVLGELVMPGFSSYLHPIDSSHLLGIGSENGCVKISLYDVSVPTSPTETSKYIVGSTYSCSDAQWDHKAVLYDSRNGLLVIPVTTCSYENPWNYSLFEQGAFVFAVSIKDGISLKGVITHSGSDYYLTQVLRSLYIGDCLYTVSQSQIKANDIHNLAAEGSLTYYVPPIVLPKPVFANTTATPR